MGNQRPSPLKGRSPKSHSAKPFPSIREVQSQLMREGEFLAQIHQSIVSPDFPRIPVAVWYTYPVNLVVLAEMVRANFPRQVREFRNFMEESTGEDIPTDITHEAGKLFGKLARMQESDPTGLAVVKYLLEDPNVVAERKTEDYSIIIEELVHLGGDRFKTLAS